MNTKATELINAVGAMVIEEKQFLTDLDAAIGDGDHGINMARGFEAVKTKLAGAPEGDVGAALKLVGMTLISTVGGAAGPLYGTAFLRAAGAAQGKELVDEERRKKCWKPPSAGLKNAARRREGKRPS